MQSKDLSLEVVHPEAAGIDIGNESHYVAVPPTRDSQPVRRFGCTTAELKMLAEWLKQCGSARWRCNLRGCIGSRSSTSWKRPGWKSIWSMRGKRRTYRGAKATYRRASG